MIRRIIFLRPFLLCLTIVACTQGNKYGNLSKENMDSIIRHMNHKVLNYRVLMQWDSSRNYLNELEDSIQKLKSARFSLNWNFLKSQQALIEKKNDSAIIFLHKALALLGDRNTNYKDSFNVFLLQQQLLHEQKKYDSALIVGNENYYLAIKHNFGVATVCLEMARMYAELDDIQNMMKYTLKGWQFKEKDPEVIHDLAHLITYYYDRNNKIDSAIYFLKIMQGNPALYHNQPAAIAEEYENQGILLSQQGKPQEGILYQVKAKNILDSMGIKYARVYNNLADTYGRLGSFDKAFMYIDSALLLAKNEKDNQLWSDIWQTKSSLYFKNGEYKSAYSSLDSSYDYYSTAQDSSLAKYGRELETKYAVRDKDNQIKILALTNASNLKIRNQQRTTIIWIVIASVFLAIIGLLLWRRRHTQMELRATNLKQQLLRVQMDPHFLFNGLSILQSLIRSGDSVNAVGYLNNLAKLMRFNFENAGENYVLFQNEIEALEAYLNLQTMYMPGLFDYQLNVYEGYEQDDIYIPPMLLQPFIENAVLHGFRGIDYKGILSVTIEKRLSSLHCVIEDNGKGILTNRLEKRTRSTKINQERLAILEKQTGIPTGLTIINKSSMDHNGTKVVVEIPFRSDKSRKLL